MVFPGSERTTKIWLENHSSLGELIDCDFSKISLTRLYQSTDKLLCNKDAIEAHLFKQEKLLFNLQQTIVLYDLTNTYFEGRALNNPQAKFGRSKEKRTEYPLVTLGLVLDGEGFPYHSDVFEGNASEAKTLQDMIKKLNHSGSSDPIIDSPHKMIALRYFGFQLYNQ